jgi:hypothetical protein
MKVTMLLESLRLKGIQTYIEAKSQRHAGKEQKDGVKRMVSFHITVGDRLDVGA